MTSQLAPQRTMRDFDGYNGRFDGRRSVHAVAPQPWMNGLEVPGPACRTGCGSFNPNVFQPAKATISCKKAKCRSLVTVPAPVAPSTVDPAQLNMLPDLRPVEQP